MSPNNTLKIIVYIAMAAFLTKCGSKDSPSTSVDPRPSCSTLAGNYSNDLDSSLKLNVNSNCTLTDTFCGYVATFQVQSIDATNSGLVDVTVFGTNGAPGCMSEATHQCDYQVSATQIAFECYNGLFLFNRE